MADIVKKSFNSPDEVQNPGEKLKVEVVTADGLKLQKITAEPGWQWSKYLKPVVGGDSCQKDHLIYIISGKGHVRMDNGKEEDFGPGDVIAIPPGHDGWNAGSEPIVWLEIPH